MWCKVVGWIQPAQTTARFTFIAREAQFKTRPFFTFITLTRGLCRMEFLKSCRPTALKVVCKTPKNRHIDRDPLKVCEWKPTGISGTDGRTDGRTDGQCFCVPAFKVCVATPLPWDRHSFSLTGVGVWMQKLIMHADLRWDLRPSGERPPLPWGGISALMAPQTTDVFTDHMDRRTHISLLLQSSGTGEKCLTF
jgi:hypothetical protein